MQILAVVVLLQDGENSTPYGVSQVLLDIKNINDIDKISIGDGDKRVLIEKKDSQWYLPGFLGLPANADLLNDLLTKLKVLKVGWPVAKTKSAAERFHVEGNKYSRHLVLFSSKNDKTELFFGDSSGLSRVHVRKKSEADIYDIKLGLHLLSVTEKDWLDKNLLQINDPIETISGKDFNLIREKGVWVLADLTSEEEVNTSELDLLISYLEKIQVTDVAKTDNRAPDFSYTVTASGKNVTYDFFKQENNHWVKSSLYAESFKIDPYFYENIRKLQRRSFIK